MEPSKRIEHQGQLVSVGGFEPPISCFQGRRGRPGSPTHCIIGAHGRTRTCTFLIRSQELYPVEPRVHCWRRDGDLNSDCSVENLMSWPVRRSRRSGSPTRTRTWIDRLTAGFPAIGRSENNGGAPRTRTERTLRARESYAPARTPFGFLSPGARPFSPA